MREQSSKILLVDDEANLLHVLSLMFMELGWEVASASGPDEAMQMVQADRYLMAFIDNQLGPMKGIELIGNLQKIDAALPCVLMSGDLNVDTTVHALRHGAAGFLRKPFRFEELLVSIEQGKRARELMLNQKDRLE